MGYYVVAIGGTGNKILESIVYAACADAFYTLDERGARVPISRLNLLSVDVDAACGNTTRAKRASEYYEDVRQVLERAGAKRRLFHTELSVEKWSMNLSRRAASVDTLTQNHRRDRLLGKTIFSHTEASLEYSEGFRGHPDLGVLFFADLLKALEQNERQCQPDEMLTFLARMREDMTRGETVRLMLCGSIFGGTGASGIPSLARFLRERFGGQSALFELGGLLMLPYYKVPASSRNEELEIVVNSSTFLDKARTALQYYGMAGLIRDGESDEKGVFDALYLLGLPPESFVTTRNYSTGSQSQENDAHMMEWLATRCVASFLKTGFRGEGARNIDCYYYQWHTPDFRWQSFDAEAEAYYMGYGALLKAAAVFFAECYPTVRAQIAGAGRRAGRVGYCAPYFGYAPRMGAAARAKLESELDSLYHFLAFYANWFIQVVRTLPPTMRQKRSLETEADDAREDYARLIKRAATLEKSADAQTQHGRELQSEYEQMLRVRDAHMRSLGGAAWLEVLKDAQTSAREAFSRQENDVEEQRDRIARWHGEDSHLIDAQTLRQEEERLAAMERARDFMRRQMELVGADVEAAIREDVTGAYPAPKAESAEALPQNALANAELLESLLTLLRQYGAGDAARDLNVMSAARERLQKGLQDLVSYGVPDTRDMARVIAGLGGGVCDGRDPDAAMAGFVSTLLEAVMEEVSA